MSKKLLTFLTLLTLFFGVGWADETITLDLKNGKLGTSNFSPQTGSATSPTATNGDITVAFGGSQTINTNPNNAYIGWNNNTTLTVTHRIYNITKVVLKYQSQTTRGTITASTGSLNHDATVMTWTVGSTNTKTVTITRNSSGNQIKLTSIEVTYESGGTTTKYTVTCNSANNGSISVGTTTEYAAGSTVTVTATPVSGYKLSSVTVNPTESGITAPTATVTGNTATFTMPASDVTIDATFTETVTTQYKLVESANDLVAGAEYMLAGKTATATTYSALLGAVNSNNIGTAVTSGFSYNTSDKILTVEAGCAATPLILGGGTNGWTFNNGSGYLAYTGTSTSGSNYLYVVTSESDDGATWTINTNNLPSNNELITNIYNTSRNLQFNGDRFCGYAASQSPVALFKKVEVGDYTITVDDTIENGSVTSNKASANGGDQVTLTVTPEAGYEVTALSYNGTAITPLTGGSDQSTYTFTMPDADVTVTATFSPRRYKVDYTQTTGGKDNGVHGVLLISGTTYSQELGYSTAEYNSEVVFKVCPEYGYQINTVTATTAGGLTVTATPGETNSNHNYYGTYYTIAHMPADAVTIAVTFKQGDIYIIGTANDNAWDGNTGVLMTYNATPNTYTARVYFKGDSDAGDEELGYGRFSFAERLSGTNGNWSNMGARYGANNNNEDPTSGNHTWTRNDSNPNAFMVAAGIYDITVNWGTGQVTATKVEPEVTLNKPSGELEMGTTVTVTSNLTQLLSAIKSGVSATLAYSIDDGTSYTDGDSFVVNEAMTAKGKAYYGKIEVISDSYNYTPVTHYAVTATANPTEGGTVSVSPASALAGESVTITATPNSGYELSSITVNGDEIDITSAPYTFTMPAAAVNVVANFTKIQYSISKAETHCTVNITGGDKVTITADGATAGAGDVVTFTVTPITNKYTIKSVTLVWNNGAATTTPTLTNGVYSFNMQARPVVITAVCEREAVGDGSFVLVTDASTLKAGDKVIITNSKATGTQYAMGAEGSNNFGATHVTIVNDGNTQKTTPGSDVTVLTLEGDATNGWYLKTSSNKYLYAASSSSNHLKTEATPDANGNAKATISVDGSSNAADIVFQGTNTHNVIMYNSSSTLFSCYLSTATMSSVYLFKQTAAGLMVEIDPDGGEVIGSQQVTIDANVEDALVQYKIGDGEWSTPAAGPVTTTITGNVGDNVKVYAKATLEDDGETLTDEADATFTFIAPNAPTITPASCSIIDVKQGVTISSNYSNGVIEYSLDGGSTWTPYSGEFDVVLETLGSSATVTARVTVNGVSSETTSATYTRDIQPVVFSPVSGTYYYGEQSVEMYSVTQGARIYYTMTDDGSEPANPVMNEDGTTLYSGEITGLEAGKTYKFKAVAYIGTMASTVSNAEYTIESPHSSGYWPNIAAMNNESNQSHNYFLENPVQVVYMSTYENNGRKPEFAYIRDNSGYGLVYFGNSGVTSYNSYTKFQMGDWLAGGTVKGYTSVWNDGFHNELGSSSTDVKAWPTDSVGNTPIIPETVTNAQVKAGWDDTNYNGSSYSSGVTADNLWGHYIHLRNNTLANVADRSTSDKKHKGVMTDPTGTTLTYYDVFYKFSGHNGAPHYDQSFFDARQNKGATFDFYGIVAFYGPDIQNASYANQPFQIVPLDIMWVYAPQISGVEEGHTYASTQTVTLNLDAVTGDDEHSSVIWYKTSEMDDYAIYTGPFEVSTTTTIDAYTTKMTPYNDRMESNHVSMDVTFTTINPPVISPESGVFAVGSTPVNSTITRNESDGLTATIWFTIDGSDPSDANSDRYEYNAQNQASVLSDIRTTTTVRAVAEYDGIYSAEAESKTYTFVKSNGIVYDLVTNVNQITENGIYVIVSQNYNEAMSNVQGETNRGAAGVMFVENSNKGQVYGNDDLAIFTVKEGNHEGEFLFETHNSNVNGFLCVESENNNTLLTEAEMDAMGNDVAVVTIDADGRAHIRYNYSGGDNRYLQYWNRDRYFTTYKTEDADRAVYIYYKNATPLASIEKEGVVGNQYTVADELIAVHYYDPNVGEYKYLWCKDQGNVSISKTEKTGDDQIDYLKDVTKVQNGDWDQSNWVVLKFETNDAASISNAVGKFIKPASITGHYTDDVNFTITMPAGQSLPADVIGGDAGFTPNVYCPVNFLDKNLNIGGGQGPVGAETGEHYFFMNPKVQEVATVTFAVWNGTCFVIPAKANGNNQGDFDGAFSVDWTYNAFGDVKTSLQANTAYHFLAVLNTVDANTNGNTSKGAKAGENAAGTVIGKAVDPQPGKTVYALDLQGGNDSQNIITAIKDVVDVTGKAVAGVKYYNLAGIESDRPFEGVNIIVTTYTDGSRSSSKVLK